MCRITREMNNLHKAIKGEISNLVPLFQIIIVNAPSRFLLNTRAVPPIQSIRYYAISVLILIADV